MTETGSTQKFVRLLGKSYPVIQCNSNASDCPVEAVVVNVQQPTVESSESRTSDAEVERTPPLKTVQNPSRINDDGSQNAETEPVNSNNSTSEEPQSSCDNHENIAMNPTAKNTSDYVEDPQMPSLETEEDIMDVVNMAAEMDEEHGVAVAGTAFQYQADAPVATDESTADEEQKSNMDSNNERSVSGESGETNIGGDGKMHGESSGQPGQDDTADTGQVSASVEETPSDRSIENPTQHLETPSDPEPGQLVSISGKLDILDYANSEWKGTTYTAQCLRKGYKMLIKATGCKFMRLVRGDNYCALRATAYQILTQKLNLFQDIPDWEQHISSVVQRLKSRFDWITQWSFAQRLQSTAANRIEVMESCLAYLVEQLKLSQAIADDHDRQLHFSALFNSGSTVEIKLFEALKLLLLDTAVQLHDASSRGEEVPVFAWLLFARDSSMDPKSLMLNHLNPAGNSGGLEQVEMCLLGQALQITIKVVRPSNVEQEDFVTFYPDHMAEKWDKVSLIAEDDRHYNIVVL